MDTMARQIGPQPPAELDRWTPMTISTPSELRYTALALRNLAAELAGASRLPCDAARVITDHATTLDRIADTIDQPPNVGPRPIRARHQGHRCPTP